jgi:hypothetical protein
MFLLAGNLVNYVIREGVVPYVSMIVGDLVSIQSISVFMNVKLEEIFTEISINHSKPVLHILQHLRTV